PARWSLRRLLRRNTGRKNRPQKPGLTVRHVSEHLSAMYPGFTTGGEITRGMTFPHLKRQAELNR
ncbi:hypothetical protein, partial [Rhizobium leguminosarum]|uniref:hypothetical protein n=1 Tax=Rhizobium leguminosarum TaxID=384 RepID=UPI001C95EC5C